MPLDTINWKDCFLSKKKKKKEEEEEEEKIVKFIGGGVMDSINFAI